MIGRRGEFAIAAWPVVGLLLFSTTALGAVIHSPTCQRADVEAAVNSASNGDTITIPAGTCTWSKTLWIQKILIIQGAGIDKTVLVSAIDPADATRTPYTAQLLALETKPGGLTRLTGLTLDSGTGVDDTYNSGLLRIRGTSTTWRVDNVRFICSRTQGVVYSGSNYGVMDHNIFDLSEWGHVGVTGWHETWGNQKYGDGSWAAPSDLGSGRAVYIEDNLFRSPTVVVAHGGYGGERVVFRYNRLEETIFANHGTESTGRNRGGRVFEVYNNTFVMGLAPELNHVVIGMRSGVGVVFNNTITGNVQNVASLHNYRDEGAYAPWGKCNGTSAWDGNQQQTGYPCLDQPGRGQSDLITGTTPTPVGWPNQKAEPTYAWNNLLNGAPGKMVSETFHIVEGRDFFNSPMPGYQPYPHPHPLVSPQSALAAPTDLQVH